MKTNLFVSAVALAAVSGGVFFITGCQPEGEPMPPGVYIQPAEKDPEKTEISKGQEDILKPGKSVADDPFVSIPDQPALPPPPAPVTKTVKPVKTKTVQKADFRTTEVKYVVKKNDSLSRIAARYGISVRALKEYNHLKKDVIYPKQVLLIPASGYKSSNAPAPKAAVKTAKKSTAKTKGASKPMKVDIPADGVHIVKRGENFSTIAKRYHMRLSDLAAANPGVNSSRLKVGQKLNVKASAGTGVDAAFAQSDTVKPAKNAKSSKASKTAKSSKSAKSAKSEKPADKSETAEETPAAAPVEKKNPEEELFKDIQDPESTAAAPAAEKAADKAPAAEKAPDKASAAEKAADKAPSAAPAAKVDSDVLGGEGEAKVDKVVTLSDGKLKITVAADTTVEQLAAKYGVTVEQVRKNNAGIPASGVIKAGTSIISE